MAHQFRFVPYRVSSLNIASGRHGALVVWGGALTAILIFSVVFWRSAWIIDDAYITFRTVEHFVEGRGLIWNPGERVQAYTHPLWMLLVSATYSASREFFYSSLALSFVCSVAAVVLAGWRARQPRLVLAIVVLMLASKACMDYTSSGLENPLSYLLISVFGVTIPQAGRALTAPRLTALSFIAALAFVNRADTVLLYVPLLLWAGFEATPAVGWRRTALAFLIGLTPALAWTVFSLVYYGLPFPNTYYAKAGSTGVPRLDLLKSGVKYYVNSLRWDPITLVMTATVCGYTLLNGRRWSRAAALGIVLYLAYVLLVGAAGTHMAGRFFSVPFFAACLLVLAVPLGRARVMFWTVVTLAAIALPAAPWKANTSLYRVPGEQGVDTWASVIDARVLATDEGGGVVTQRPGATVPNHAWFREGLAFRRSGLRLRVGGALSGAPVGFFAFGAGPDVFVVDKLGLADPLLSHLPIDPGTGWSPGHFARSIPDGYLESVAADFNYVRDPSLHLYYERIRLITRGPILDAARFRAIVALNLGLENDLVRAYHQAHLARAESPAPVHTSHAVASVP
jgi:arabinofuranosyltransferase